MSTRPAADNVSRMEFLLGLRRRGISDAAVLRAMEEVPRDQFVEADFTVMAYADQALPICCGQTISQPYVVAYMTEKLGVTAGHRVLEIGTGSGYQAAVLSRLAREVTSIERFRTLASVAADRLRRLGYDNVDVVVGDGMAGHPARAPYDRIVVTAAADRIPELLLDQLTDNGRLILPVGPQDAPQRLILMTKTPDGVRQEDLMWVRFVPLLPGQAREL